MELISSPNQTQNWEDKDIRIGHPCPPLTFTMGINNFYYNSSIKDFAFSRSAMKRWWFFDFMCRHNFSDRTVLSLRWVFKLILTRFIFGPMRNSAHNLKTGLLCITLKIIWHSSQNKAPKQNLILTFSVRKKNRTRTQLRTCGPGHFWSLYSNIPTKTSSTVFFIIKLSARCT